MICCAAGNIVLARLAIGLCLFTWFGAFPLVSDLASGPLFKVDHWLAASTPVWRLSLGSRPS